MSEYNDNKKGLEYYDERARSFDINYDARVAGEKLKRRREACNYTQEQLSEDLETLYGLKTSRQEISAIENGKKIKKVKLLLALCKILECDPQYLLGWCDTLRVKDAPVAELLALDEEAINQLTRLKEKIDEWTQLEGATKGQVFNYIMSSIIKKQEFFPLVFEYCCLDLDKDDRFINIAQKHPQIKPSQILAGRQAQISCILMRELSEIRKRFNLPNYEEEKKKKRAGHPTASINKYSIL